MGQVDLHSYAEFWESGMRLLASAKSGNPFAEPLTSHPGLCLWWARIVEAVCPVYIEIDGTTDDWHVIDRSRYYEKNSHHPHRDPKSQGRKQTGREIILRR